MKLYRYRPLNDLLYKELLYQEMYFGSYSELNDPLDLSTRIDFTPTDSKSFHHLTYLLSKVTLELDETNSKVVENNKGLVAWAHSSDEKALFEQALFNELKEVGKRKKFVSADDLIGAITRKALVLPFEFNASALGDELRRLTSVFLESSYICSFSERMDSFLMWSHYSSRHSGVCLEFELDKQAMFAFRMKGHQERNEGEEKHRLWKTHIEYANYVEAVKPVAYLDTLPVINYFEFVPVFGNEGDADLMGLSKSWTHIYAAKLEQVFRCKLEPWSYEKEWRAIEINFGKVAFPENRIRHYLREKLTAVYFGIRTPDEVKHRIYDILKRSNDKIVYYNSYIRDGALDFIEWYDPFWGS